MTDCFAGDRRRKVGLLHRTLAGERVPLYSPFGAQADLPLKCII